jgi:hypothetical protein
MATGRFNERLSAAPTPFRQVSNGSDSCAEFTVAPVSAISSDRLVAQSVKSFHVWAACSGLLALRLQCPSRREPEEMLKITITNTAKEEKWILQGRLVAPWVKELKANWNKMRRVAERGKCIVNLDEVTFIDRSGERMLRCMSRQGAQLVASDVYVKHVLRRLRGKSN